MKVAVFSTHRFEMATLQEAAGQNHELLLLTPQLAAPTAILARGCEAACIFVNDDASAPVLQLLHQNGVRYLVLRSAGFNHVDLEAAASLGIAVSRVPEYSPHAVAEHTIALIMTLNRKLVKAANRVREGNFSLDGLTGFDMWGKTAGVIGTGKIGKCVAEILLGFGCQVLAYDPFPDNSWASLHQVKYVTAPEVFRQSHIITLHAPLTNETKYMINRDTISTMKRGVMLINTSRGALVATKEVVEALKTGQIGYLGLDVYEEEKALFFEDRSEEILQDDVIARLMTFPNVLITSHQAFLTDTALRNIAATTMHNLDCFASGTASGNELP